MQSNRGYHMLKTKEILGEQIDNANQKYLKELKEQVSKDKVTWILGAGISKSVGVPLWPECLLKMWSRILMLEKENTGATSEFHHAIKELKSQIKKPEKFLEKINATIKGESSSEILSGVNTLEAAEYIQNFVRETIEPKTESAEELYELAYAALVKDSLKIGKADEEIWEQLKGEVIGELAAYFIKNFQCNKGVHVISYNFDNLLEFALEKSGLNKKDCHIKNPGTTNVLEEGSGVHIYHPHGTVEVVSTDYSQESKKLVLAESSYARLEQKAYLWENSIQARALHSTSCVFLGFSGEDYNFRRIIKNMEQDKECQELKHYLFLSIESLVKKIFQKEINNRLLGDIARTESEREKYLSEVSREQYDKVLREAVADESMIYEKMLIIKKLQAQCLYWQRYNIIPIWTTRKELTELVGKILN